jgi:hypothetical protein
MTEAGLDIEALSARNGPMVLRRCRFLLKDSMKTLLTAILVTAIAPLETPPQPPPSMRRFALVAGANDGGTGRPALRYAVRDAERFSNVLTSMGGVAKGDATILREPAPRAFVAALDALGKKAKEAKESRGGSSRVEVLVYFSGHADEQGLLLGADRLRYEDLRAAIRAMPVDVGIAVLDACASGAITRLKGGKAHPAFLSDVSMDVQGYAFLASSSEGEAAQESDRLGGSYFTHALLTGMRGAADVSGDGRVTLSEAYQFAFHETLAQTTTSQGGAQHPSYDIKMAGTGDVVMTDVRKISASLILGADYDGRFHVLDARGHLIAELQKSPGRAVELGLEPGEYRVYYEESKKLLSTPLRLGDGQRQELVRGGLKPAKRLPTLSRGGAGAPDPFLGGTRVEFVARGWGEDIEALRSGGVITSRISDPPIAGSLLHWRRATLAFEVGITDRGLIESDSTGGTFVGATRGIVFGARYYPRVRSSLRPFAVGNFGVYDDVGTDARRVPDRGLGLGITFGFGADLLLGRRMVISTRGTMNAVSSRGSRMDVLIGAGWHWGGPRRH